MKYIFLLISLCYSITNFAQVEIINESLTDSSLNIFYTGIDNRIKLKVKKDIPEYTIVVKGTGAVLSKISEDEYLVKVSIADSCEVIVHRNRKDILIKKYKVSSIPDPIGMISGLRDTTIKLNRLLQNPFIMLVLPGCYYRNRFTLFSFRAVVIQDADSINLINNGYIFSEELIKSVKRLVHGDKICFEDIRYVGPDDRTRKLDPFWIKINKKTRFKLKRVKLITHHS